MIKKEIFQIDDCELKKIFNEIKEDVYSLPIKNDDVKGFGIYDSEQPNKDNNRYYLELNIKDVNSNKTLVTIMMNPSTTLPDNDQAKIDKTVQNVIKIAKAQECSKVIILNALPIINSNLSDALQNQNEDKKNNNKQIVTKYFSENYSSINTIFLAAWGANKKIHNYINQIGINWGKIENIKAYSINKASDTPAHPNGRGNNGENAKNLKAVCENQQVLISVIINKDLTVTIL